MYNVSILHVNQIIVHAVVLLTTQLLNPHCQ